VVDYSNQKPVQNPSYIKKPPTKSQLTAGGDGGKGAALAANVNGASGQANQETSMFAPGKGLTYNPNAPKLPDITPPTFSPGVLRVGGQASYPEPLAPSKLGGIVSNLASSIPNPFKAQEGSANTTPPTISPKPTISSAAPVQPEVTKAALGQFTTPTGGFANVSISPNQDINTRPGMGLHQLTPDQQSFLQGTIDRNARPEVQAEFAKQAQIVNDRIAASKGEDIAALQKTAAGYSPNKIGSYEAAHLAQQRLGTIATENNAAANNQVEQAKAIMQQGTSLAKQQSEENKAKLGSRQESVKQMLSADNGMATPATRNAIFKQYNPGQSHDLESVKLVHANDPSMIEALSSGDPQAISDALMSAGHTKSDIENILKTSNLL